MNYLSSPELLRKIQSAYFGTLIAVDIDEERRDGEVEGSADYERYEWILSEHFKYLERLKVAKHLVKYLKTDDQEFAQRIRERIAVLIERHPLLR